MSRQSGLQQGARLSCRGLTLIEMLAVMVMIGVLSGLAAPPMWGILDQVKVTQAIADINAIQMDLLAIEAGGDSLPNSLSAIGRGAMHDPWGNPYQYLVYDGSKNPKGARKDRALHPLNSDFDLYSKGADGASQLPITSGASQDDIIRANDGGFIGLARNY